MLEVPLSLAVWVGAVDKSRLRTMLPAEREAAGEEDFESAAAPLLASERIPFADVLAIVRCWSRKESVNAMNGRVLG